MKKAVIIGAGRIGRGFLAELLLANQMELTFFAATEATVGALNRQKQYEIHVLGDETKNTIVKNVEAFLISDISALAQRWAEADFLFTACGGKNLPSAGASLAAAFRKLCADQRVHVSNIITCENWVDPAGVLKEAILRHLTQKEGALFEANTGLGEAAVMCSGTGAPDPSKVTNPCDTWVQDAWYLPIDGSGLKGELPKLQYLEFKSDFGALLKQKLYTRNTSIAAIAYLGRLKGLTYVAEGARDPEIAPILEELYGEVSEILIRGEGIDREEQLEFARKADQKNRDEAIVDLLTRIARDPIRKLGPEDRLIGPIRQAFQTGVEPKAVALGCAAALYYENPKDEAAIELGRMRRVQGIDYILQHICELDPRGPEAECIKKAVIQLKERGWIKEV